MRGLCAPANQTQQNNQHTAEKRTLRARLHIDTASIPPLLSRKRICNGMVSARTTEIYVVSAAAMHTPLPQRVKTDLRAICPARFPPNSDHAVDIA